MSESKRGERVRGKGIVRVRESEQDERLREREYIWREIIMLLLSPEIILSRPDCVSPFLPCTAAAQP